MREMGICKGPGDPLLRRQTRECGGDNHRRHGRWVPEPHQPATSGGPRSEREGELSAQSTSGEWAEAGGAALFQWCRREAGPGYFVASHARTHAGGRTDDDGRPDHVCVSVCV